MSGKAWWWIRQIGLIGLGGFFLYFGILILIGAYALDNPSAFILTFFASNFIILISAALLAGFIYRLVVVIRLLNSESDTKKYTDPGDDLPED